METLEALERRIQTTEELGSIVRTMTSLSTVSIRQYERAVEALHDHRRAVELGLQVVLRATPAGRVEPAAKVTRGAFLVLGSDRGLCGRFNEAVTDLADQHIRADPGPGQPVVLAVGARAAGRLEALGHAPETIFLVPGSVEGLAATTQAILVGLDAWRADAGVGRIVLVANRQTETVPAEAYVCEILPMASDYLRQLSRRPWPSRRLPTFSVAAPTLLSWLLRQHLYVELFAAGAESLASEHAARLSAMHAAKRNIEERLDEIQAAFRRERQSAITTELLDVVSGFEALASATSA
jgi:F-type H+-transporting ATPase subunit gamma